MAVGAVFSVCAMLHNMIARHRNFHTVGDAAGRIQPPPPPPPRVPATPAARSRLRYHPGDCLPHSLSSRPAPRGAAPAPVQSCSLPHTYAGRLTPVPFPHSMEESVDNGGESILRTLMRARVSDARASELSVTYLLTYVHTGRWKLSAGFDSSFLETGWLAQSTEGAVANTQLLTYVAASQVHPVASACCRVVWARRTRLTSHASRDALPGGWRCNL